MHIIVPIKQVPETEDLRYDPATRTLVREGVTSVINPYDKRPLTEALRLRELYGGSITAITMGPPHARAALIECLGRGVDRCIHLTDHRFAGSDTLATARALSAAIRRVSFDLILTGKATTDSETGQVGPELAELLDLPQITGATAIEVQGDILTVTRETDYGFETLECELPALLTAAERLIKPIKTKPPVLAEGERRILQDPSLIGTWSARDLDLTPEEVGLSGSPTWVAELRPVEIARAHTMLTGDPDDMARPLVARLADLRPRTGAQERDNPPIPPAPPVPYRRDRRVWAVAELMPHPQGETPRLRAVSLELASEAARIAAGVDGAAWAILMGYPLHQDPYGLRHKDYSHLTEALASCGLSWALLADDPRLEHYSVEPYAWALATEIEHKKPWAVLFPATDFGRDLAPRVAARLGLGLTGDCTGFELDAEDRLLALKPAFGGQVIAPIVSRTLPQLATVRPGILPISKPLNNGPFGMKTHHMTLDDMPPSRTRLVSTTRAGEGIALDRARLVVCVGMGIGGPGALPEIRRFASAIGAWLGFEPDEVAIGGTRKVVDEGWLPRQQQIGITGRAVAPDLYVGIGLQGNLNHTAGIMRSGTIIAINSDRSAPIFEAADIGVVADWHVFAQAVHYLLHETYID